MNERLNTMHTHRSIRSYLDKPVESEKLDQIIGAVQAAPNWVNMQQVSVIAVKDAKRREIMAELCGGQKHIAEAPVFLVFCADYYRTNLACKKHGQDLDKIIEDIDHLLVGSHEVGISLGTAVIAAELLGLGTVPIGDVRLNALKFIKALNLPKYVIPILGLCIGYPASSTGLKPRLPKEAVYFSETYNHDLEGLLDSYDELYAEYLQKRPLNNRAGNWTELVADFYKYPYSHYPEVEKMIKQQGFLKKD